MAETQVRNGWLYQKVPGGWQKVGPAGPPADPTFETKGPQARATLGKTQVDAEGVAIDNAFDRRTLDDRAAAEKYKALKAQYEALQAERQFNAPAQIGEEQRREAIKAWAAAQEIDQTIPDIERAFNAGPGATRGMMGIRDFMPTAENQSFDAASNRLRAPLKSILGFTGSENNAVQESQMNVGPFVPSSWYFDRTNRDTLGAVRKKAEAARNRAALQLGGMPDSNGRVTPIPQGYRMGQYPDLDRAVAAQIDRVPPQKRPAYMMDARRRYLEKVKRAPRKSAFEFLGFED